MTPYDQPSGKDDLRGRQVHTTGGKCELGNFVIYINKS